MKTITFQPTWKAAAGIYLLSIDAGDGKAGREGVMEMAAACDDLNEKITEIAAERDELARQVAERNQSDVSTHIASELLTAIADDFQTDYLTTAGYAAAQRLTPEQAVVLIALAQDVRGSDTPILDAIREACGL